MALSNQCSWMSVLSRDSKRSLLTNTMYSRLLWGMRGFLCIICLCNITTSGQLDYGSHPKPKNRESSSILQLLCALSGMIVIIVKAPNQRAEPSLGKRQLAQEMESCVLTGEIFGSAVWLWLLTCLKDQTPGWPHLESYSLMGFAKPAPMW